MKDAPEEHNNNEDEAQEGIISKEKHVPRLVRIEMQTKILPWSEGMVLVATHEKGLVQVRTLLEWESTQAWTTDPGVIDAFQTGHLM